MPFVQAEQHLFRLLDCWELVHLSDTFVCGLSSWVVLPLFKSKCPDLENAG
jgi:hypothetical protein